MLSEAFMSVNEAAEQIGISAARVRQLLIAEEMKGQKLGERMWAISKSEVDRFAALDPPGTGRPRGS